MDNNEARQLATDLRKHLSDNADYIDGYSKEYFDQAATALEAYAQQAEVCGEWQDIETAPHGVDVLLYTPSLPVVITRESDKYEVRPYSFGDIAKSYHSTATHWMPLPVPPIARAEKMGV